MTASPKRFPCLLVSCVLMVAIAAAASEAPAADATADAPQPAAGFDLITNGSFEHDWYNTRPEIMSCPLEPRVMFGQADSYPDGWGLVDPTKPAGTVPAPVSRVASGQPGKSGAYAALVPAAQALVQDDIPYGAIVGAPFQAAPLKLSAWVKGGAAKLTVTVNSLEPAAAAAAGQSAAAPQPKQLAQKTVDAPAAADWSQATVELPAPEIDAAVKSAGKPVGSLYVMVSVAAQDAE